MCIVFMSLMLGTLQPMMFPCAFMFIVSFYALQKFLMVFWYAKSPQFDDTLAKIVMSSVKYGALLFCGFSYWILTNPQMFDNKIHSVDYQKEGSNAYHSIYDIPQNQTLILFVGFFVLLAYLVFYDAIRDTFG